MNKYDLKALDIISNCINTSYQVVSTEDILQFISFENPDVFKKMNKKFIIICIQNELIIKNLNLISKMNI